MRKTFLSLVVVTILFTISCQNKTEVKPDEHAGHSNQNSEGKPTGKFTAELKTNPAEAKAGEPTELNVTIKNPSGETVKDVEIVHEKPIHLLIVSNDLAEFYHEHPEPQSDGSFKVPFTFKNGGKYKLYADFTPKNGAQTVQLFDLSVSGNPRRPLELVADQTLEKSVDGLLVSMKPSADLTAGQSLSLNFNVADAATKQPVTDLQNYLGALAHFVVISEDLQEFVHAHPSEHGDQHSHTEAKSDATVAAQVNFPKAGLYKVFAQFQRAGKVIVVPFVVEVKSGEPKAENGKNGEIPKDAYRITASRDGFAPSEIKIAKDNYKQLAFVRTDSENCADEIVFKSLNITKKLPVGEVVLIDLPKDFSGELAFACGMNMMKGKVVVE